MHPIHTTETSSPLSPSRRNSMVIDLSLRRAQSLHVRHGKCTAQHRLAEPVGGAPRALRHNLGGHLEIVVVVHVETVVAVVAECVEQGDEIRKRVDVLYFG